MRQLILATGAVIILANIATAQNSKLQCKDGMTVNIEVQSWPDALIGDANFLNAKENKKDALVAERNADIISGKIAPAKFSMVYKVTKEATDADADAFKATTTISGKEYASYLKATKDTLYIFRSKGVLTSENGANWGSSIQGVEKIPFNIKVGDVLPVYEDIGILYPKTTNKIEKVWDEVSKGREYTTYQLIDVEVRKTVSVNSQALNNVDARVTRSENMSINGKSYNAFVIESETWTKGQMNVSYETSQRATTISKEYWQKKNDAKAAKRLVKSGFTNEDGFVVLYKEEWFVPELGVVKLRTYDMFGAIVSDVVSSPVL